MDLWKLFSYVSILLGIASLTSTTLAPTHDSTVNEESKHLALRQVAHQLYVASGDSTSMIAPTNRYKETYSVQLTTPVDYSKMPKIIQQATLDYGIDQDYQVSIRDCITDKLVLGYNNNALNLSDVPCQDRHQVDICYVLGLTYPSSNGHKGLMLVGGLIMLMGGTVSLYKQRNSIDHAVISPASLDNTETTDNSEKPQKALVDINHHLLCIGTRKIELTYREAKLMQYLLSNKNTILNREDILEAVWGDDGLVVGRSLDVFISRLRKILKAEDLTDQLHIKTVHGIGYQLLTEE